MYLRLSNFRGLIVLASILFLVCCGTVVFAQDDTPAAEEVDEASLGGIKVNPMGVVTHQMVENNGPLVMRYRQAAESAYRSIPRDLSKPSRLRLVSLNGLEKQIIDNGGKITPDMQFLAGLTKIQYMFYLPETKDIVIAGPAEGWIRDPEGTYRGYISGSPVLRLEDMVVALRAFSPNGKQSDLVGCSIDPTQEGLVRMNDLARSVRVLNTHDDRVAYMHDLVDALGLNEVSVYGVDENTRFAQVLVAADYRMKRIGLGLEPKPAPMTTYIEKTDAKTVSGLIRWFFVPDYKCLKVTEDRFGMELIGNSVKLVEESEAVAADGSRTVKGGSGNAASMTYVKSFTNQYPRIAANVPVYAELRNLIDMLVCAAYIQSNDFYKESGWNMAYFGDESKFKTQMYPSPKFVEPIVNMKTVGRRTAYPISGGVQIEPTEALDSKNVTKDDGKLEKAKDRITTGQPNDRWWWDAR